MPREQIQFTDPDNRDWYVGMHVGWNGQGGWAQVGFEVNKTQLIRMLEDYDPDRDGKLMLWSDLLTRNEANKTIKTIRTARDRAFGKDE